MPTADELAKELGISPKRHREIRQIVEQAAQRLEMQTSRRSSASKTSASRSKAA